MALLFGPVASHAAWQLVSDFEGAGALDVVTFTKSPESQTDGNGGISLATDPTNSANQVLKLDPGTFPSSGGSSNQPSFFIPHADITGKGTVYVRFAKLGDLVDIVWGTTPVAAPTSYGDFSSGARVEIDTIFDYRAGSDGYVEIAGSASSANTWYDTWFVVDVPTNTYDLWIKGGGFTSATKVVTGADFRKQSTDPQNVFYARSTTGNITNPLGVDSVIFDNLWVDTSGENISIPSKGSGNSGEISGGSVPADNGAGKLSNLSTNAEVGASGLVAGFVVTQDDRRVLVRAVGPGLAQFGVTGVMADPTIEIKNAAGVSMGTNDNWGSATNAADVKATMAVLGAFGLEDTSLDAAIMVKLPKGVYTAEVKGVSGSTGRAIIEVYTLD